MSSVDAVQDETTVLLVEDNEGDARLIEEMIHMKGSLLDDSKTLSPNIELERVDRLGDGLDRLDTGGVDIVLLDLMLPDSSGEATLDAVLDHTESVPVVLLTGLNDRDFGVKAVQRGAQDYLVKGEIDGELLVRTMRYAIERKKNERELAQRTNQLAVLTQVLEHDIRNDMNVVAGTADLLRAEVGDEHAGHVDQIRDNVNHVVEITETASELLETVTGESELSVEPRALDAVLDAELAKARTSHEHAEVTVAGDIPAVDVLADSMLSSVFSNLLNNAVQHNDAATPRVTVSVEAGPETVRVAVADNGPGVPDGHKTSIFSRGERGVDSTGTGVGLYLVQTLVDQYGGSVAVTDAADGGAVFEVELQRV
jgi:signal transduction histidine kinase